MPASITTPRPIRSSPAPQLARLHRGTTPSAGTRATPGRKREITSLPSTASGEGKDGLGRHTGGAKRVKTPRVARLRFLQGLSESVPPRREKLYRLSGQRTNVTVVPSITVEIRSATCGLLWKTH